MNCRRFALLAVALLSPALALCATEPIEIEVPYFTPVKVREYGGLNRDIVIESDDQSSIRMSIVDHTKTVLRQRSTYRVQLDGQYLRLYGGYDRIPLIRPRNIPKEGGENAPGTLQKLYRLYRDRTGVAVYFRDTLATAQGSVRLRIIPAVRPTSR